MPLHFPIKRIAASILLGSILLCVCIPNPAFADERDARFLLPSEVPSNGSNPNIQSTGMRDMSFLLPIEAPNTSSQASLGARDMSFLTPNEANAKGSASGFAGARRNGSANIGNCREWVNVRKDPSTKNKPIGKAIKGALINILYWSNDGVWAYAQLNDKLTGWVHGRFVTY